MFSYIYTYPWKYKSIYIYILFGGERDNAHGIYDPEKRTMLRIYTEPKMGGINNQDGDTHTVTWYCAFKNVSGYIFKSTYIYVWHT
jgi:hypothetical protein